ncbi:MAG: phosphoribosylglycinamide formyltransferase [Candidatus Stygibacter frigidus]|nr:phosphoribosylglycinamide formyltransferase [Candidatus Stygibacter frigidus]
MEKKRLLIMISGRGSNMEALLKNTISGELGSCAEIIGVFSNKAEAPGLEIAKRLGFPVKVIASKGKKRKHYNAELKEWLVELDPDYIILAGYMLIIPSNIVTSFPERIINIHPADTTQHQGLHGYEWAWKNKLPETMITIHYVDNGLDTGRIIAQERVNLMEANTLEEVEIRGLEAEHRVYGEVLAKICRK